MKKKSKKLISMLLTALFIATCTVTSGVNSIKVKAEEVVKKVPPIADAYVHGNEWEVGKPHGTGTSLPVKESADAYTRRSFVKFDLSNMNEISTNNLQSAKLKLYFNSATSGRNVCVYKADNSNWDEGVLWTNQPYTKGTSVLISKNTMGGAGWYEWDVTEFVRERKSVDGIVGFSVVGDSDHNHNFNSRENTTLDSAEHPTTPYLEITYEAPADAVAPQYLSSSLSRDNKVLSLIFDENVIINYEDIKAYVLIAKDGSNYNNLEVTDSIEVNGSELKISFETPLRGRTNKIKLTNGALKDEAGNLTSEIVTGDVEEMPNEENTPVISKLRQAHPRIMATAEDFESIKTRVAGDARAEEWFNALVTKANEQIAKPVATYTLDSAGQLLTVSRDVAGKLEILSFMYRLTGDVKYADRAWQELDAVSKFQDWHSGHFLDTAEMTFGFAIAYDWLYDYLSPQQKLVVREAIITKGLNMALESYRLGGGEFNRHGWIKSTNNWNSVCNGSMGVAALAIGDESPFLAEEILMHTRENLPYMLEEFAPDGAWPEGSTYWGYAMKYLVNYLAALDTAVGEDFGISQYPGMDRTGDFPIYVVGANGQSFNYGDAGTGTTAPSEMLWLAKKYNKPEYAWWRLTNKSSSADYKDLLWYPTTEYPGAQAAGLALDKLFKDVEMVTFRDSWENNNGLSVAMKAGSGSVNHSNLDSGSFVLDAMGTRWAVELGAESYTVPGYWNSGDTGTRWNYYRERAEGQNTVVINPGIGPDQIPSAFSEIIKYQTNDHEALAVADLTTAYANTVDKYLRGIKLFDNRSKVLLQDEISAKADADIWWFMHTGANIKIMDSGKSAILTLGSKRLWAHILGDNSLEFNVRDAESFFTSPDTAGTGEYDRSGFKKLSINAKGEKDLTISVLFVPVKEGDEVLSTLPTVAALDSWQVSQKQAVKLDNIMMNGEPLQGFIPGKFTYDIVLPMENSTVPAITAVANDSTIRTRVIPASAIPGTALIEVTALDWSKDKSVYRIHFNKPIDLNSVVFASKHDGNIPENTLDGDLITRWSAEGENEWITFNLGSKRSVDEIKLSFFNGHRRATIFDVEVSDDFANWTNVFSGQSSGTTSDLETFALTPVEGRFLRILGHGNTSNKWNSIQEVVIDGVSMPNAEPVLKEINVSSENTQVARGDTVKLSVTGKLTDGTLTDMKDAKITYISTKGELAEVLEDGYVKGLGIGIVKIGVEGTLNYITKRSTITINVTPSPEDLDYKLYPKADTFVNAGEPTKGFGSSTELLTKNNNGGIYTREAFLQFDLGLINKNILSAKLYVYGKNSEVAKGILYDTEDDWTEAGVTYNNRPVAGEKIGELDFTDTTAYQWVEIDLTQYIKAQYAKDKLASLKLENSVDKYLVLASRETANSAYLMVKLEADKTALNEKIEELQSLYDSSEEGTTLGTYNQGAKAELMTAIDAAREVVENTAATVEELNSAAAALNSAVDKFKKRLIVVDGMDMQTLEDKIRDAEIQGDTEITIEVEEGKRELILAPEMIQQLSDANLGLKLSFGNVELILPAEAVDFADYTEGMENPSVAIAAKEVEDISDMMEQKPEELKAVGKVFDFTLKVVDGELQREISEFNTGKKVKVCLKLTEEELTNVDTSKLSAYYYNPELGVWEEIGGSLNSDTLVFTFEVEHFSVYTLMEKTVTPTDGGGTSDGSDQGETGSDQGGTGSDQGGTGSDQGGTGSDQGGTGSDQGGTGIDQGEAEGDQGEAESNQGEEVPGKGTEGTLVQTGSVIDATVMILAGIIILLAGVFILNSKSNKRVYSKK